MSRWDGGVPVRQVKVYAQDGNGEHTEVKAENGALKVSLASPLSAFGELMIADNTPLVQVDAVYGLRTTDMDTVVGNGGAVTSADKLFVCSSGATSGGYASARSSRGFRYRPGQAGCARFTALFDKTGAVANNTQRAGFLCHEGSLGFRFPHKAQDLTVGRIDFAAIKWKQRGTNRPVRLSRSGPTASGIKKATAWWSITSRDAGPVTTASTDT